jgi:hypothetical protein
MISEIKIYLFVLSVIFLLKTFVFELSMRLFEDNPVPLSLSDNVKILIYLSVSYVITFLILM